MSDFSHDPSARQRRTLRAPWHFRLARHLIGRSIPGGYRLIDTSRRLGWLNVIVPYRLRGGVILDVPLSHADSPLTEEAANNYERHVVEALSAEVRRRFPRPCTLIDCGADIGLVSSLLCAGCPNIDCVIAFEPNREVFPALKSNIERLRTHNQCFAAAVSDYSGSGELRNSPTDESSVARFMVPAADGDISVMRLDDLSVDVENGIVLKIDVEGAELAVLHGARRTLSRAAWFAISFEAHPGVMARTGIDPIQCVRFLRSLDHCHFRIAELPEIRLLEDRPFFDQVPRRNCNVICWQVD